MASLADCVLVVAAPSVDRAWKCWLGAVVEGSSSRLVYIGARAFTARAHCWRHIHCFDAVSRSVSPGILMLVAGAERSGRARSLSSD